MLDRLPALHRPRISVHKFSSCDGCQLSILDCEEELLTLAEATEIAYFAEASSDYRPGPYDVTFVEGSVSTPDEVERTQAIRAATDCFVAFGVCATAGGIQALRNAADAERMKAVVYPHPELVKALPTSTPHSAHVKVDFEIQGCPPNRWQILEVVTQLLLGKPPRLPTHSVCQECKRKGNVCVLVARGLPCMGPVTQDGCGALCPSYDRACYGCFGPMDDPKPERFSRELELRGFPDEEIVRRFQEIASGKEPFIRGAERYRKP